MPRRKTDSAAAPAATPEAPASPPTKATVERKPVDWNALVRVAATTHWRTLRVTIAGRGKLMAGKPAALASSPGRRARRRHAEQMPPGATPGAPAHPSRPVLPAPA